MNKVVFSAATCAAILFPVTLPGAQVDPIRLVKDIVPGSKSGAPVLLAELNRTLYFLARPGGGLELWKSRGSEASTVRVASLPKGQPTSLVSAGNNLFFTVNVNGMLQLWASDGTEAGTHSLGSGSYRDLTPWGDVIAFTNEALHGRELWISDGTAEGTGRVTDLGPLDKTSNPEFLTPFGNLLVFAASDEDQRELWTLDRAGNLQMINVNPDRGGLPPASSNPEDLTVFGGRVYFSALDKDFKREMFHTDGTAGGTGMFTLSNDPLVASDPGPFVAAGDKLFFWARLNLNTGRELWVSDGSNGGTHMILDLVPGAGGLLKPLDKSRVGNRLIFNVNEPGKGSEFWVSDGTALGTEPLKGEIVPGVAPGPRDPVAFGSRYAYFVVDDGVHGVELWRTNGMTSQDDDTRMIQDLNPVGGSNPHSLVQVGAKIFLAAKTQATGVELFVYDPGAISADVGLGCSARALTPKLEADDPVLGGTVEVTGENSPLLSVGYLNLGFLADEPVDFGPGCTVYLDLGKPIALIGVVQVQNPTWTDSFDVPNDPSLVGHPFALQAAYLLLGGPAYELSEAVSLNVGR